ncbi:MAG: DUF3343 domain-containing protein [bacterium]|nr:DUF3343 domain-containing protein [bacterium]
MHYVILFNSVHFVMKAEKAIKEKGIGVQLIPVPRQFSSDCGMAIKIKEENIESVKQLLEKGSYKVEGIHKISE